MVPPWSEELSKGLEGGRGSSEGRRGAAAGWSKGGWGVCLQEHGRWGSPLENVCRVEGRLAFGPASGWSVVVCVVAVVVVGVGPVLSVKALGASRPLGVLGRFAVVRRQRRKSYARTQETNTCTFVHLACASSRTHNTRGGDRTPAGGRGGWYRPSHVALLAALV